MKKILPTWLLVDWLALAVCVFVFWVGHGTDIETFCTFAAGMSAERFLRSLFVLYRAHVVMKRAIERANAQRSECDCGSINGHPHEPDCVWWSKRNAGHDGPA